jgi:hypothetical protein
MDVAMPTITIEIPTESEALVRRVLALHDELQTLALSAPEGTVLDACEAAVIPRTRDLARQALCDAVARRVESAEKRGRRCAPAPADGPKKTEGPPAVSSSRPSAS